MGKKCLWIILILAVVVLGIFVGLYIAKINAAHAPTPSHTTARSTNPTIYPSFQPTTTQGVLSEEETLAEVIRGIVDNIENAQLQTDLERIGYAARLVNQWINQCEDAPEGEGYDTPYFFLVERKYTYLGPMQSLKAILDAMGYTWSHINENTDQHQWLEVDNVDGKTAFADPIVVGMVGFGDPYEDDCYYYDWENGLVFYR
jgi:hypothetical protein